MHKRSLQPFEYEPLGRVISGADTLQQLGEVARPHGQRALLVTDPGLFATGHPQRAMQSLRDAGLDVHVFDGVKENPTELEVRNGVAHAQMHRADLLVAVGGGSAMDCAKGINFLLTNGGRMIDYRGHGKATKPMLPSIGVPTTAGTGSEAQSYALITDPSSHMKMACGDKKAAFTVSILDPVLTLTQPSSVTAVTGIDAVAHAVESLVSTKANVFSRLYSQAAWQHLEANFECVLREPDHLGARAGMQIGAHLAGAAIEASMLGICHSCANPLTAHYGITHGAAIAVMLPHVIRFNAANNPILYSAIAPDAEQLARRVEQLIAAARMPATLESYGVSWSILELLAHEANQQWTARFNPRPVSETELLEVYRRAYCQPERSTP